MMSGELVFSSAIRVDVCSLDSSGWCRGDMHGFLISDEDCLLFDRGDCRC